MLRVAPTNPKGKSLGKKCPSDRENIPSGPGYTQFPGLVADAKALGVSRVHLWFVLSGRRESARLRARYEALKAQQAAAPIPAGT